MGRHLCVGNVPKPQTMRSIMWNSRSSYSLSLMNSSPSFFSVISASMSIITSNICNWYAPTTVCGKRSQASNLLHLCRDKNMALKHEAGTVHETLSTANSHCPHCQYGTSPAGCIRSRYLQTNMAFQHARELLMKHFQLQVAIVRIVDMELHQHGTTSADISKQIWHSSTLVNC